MKKTLLAINIALFILLLNFRFLVFNESFYEEKFEELGVYNKISQEIAAKNSKSLIGYLKGNNDLETDFFNEKEKLHLKDVKNLIRKTIIIFYISILTLMLLLYINKENIKKSLLYSGVLLILIPIIILLINFNSLFYNFHIISFNNNLWQLNPETDNLINLFPQQFFQDFLTEILINSLIIGVLLIIISFFLKYRSVGKFKVFSKKFK